MRPQDQAVAEAQPVLKPLSRRWPPQIKFIVGNEACERFSFYGMKGILALYITLVLLKTDDNATNIIALFSAANYFMPLLGAWVSDRYWGRYHTILWISLSYCLGHAVLATSDFIPTISGKTFALYLGLGLIAFGSGGIKPCVSAFMGDQFKPEQRHLLQKAYAAFYWSINLGSFFSFLAIPFIRKHWGYSWAFGVPGIFMAIATLIFWFGRKYYTHVPPTHQTRTAGFLTVFFSALCRHDAITGEHARPGHTGWGARPPRARGLAPSPATPDSTDPLVTMKADEPTGEGADGLRPGRACSPNPFEPLPLRTGLAWGALLNFLTAIVLPLLAMAALTFVALTHEMTPLARALNWGALVCIGLWYVSIVATSLLGRAELPNSFWHAARARHTEPEISAARSVSPLLFVFAFIPIFWALFDQTFSTWVLQGEKMVPFKLGSWTIGPEEMLSANPALVMILIPIMTWGLYPMMGRLATPLRRMSSGMFMAAFSYVVVALLQARLEHGAQLSVLWQTVPYVILTIAEVLVSTTGLEFAFREAAPEMKSIIMGFFNLTITMGNLMVVGITKAFANAGPGAHNTAVSTRRFLMYAGLTFIVAILFSVIAAFYRYRDEAAARGK